jgi:alkylhydroperoxidase family enzyme
LQPTIPVYGMTPERRRRFHEQLAGIPAETPVVPSGLGPFMHLPAPEPRTLTRARLAQTIAERVAADGRVTRDELLAAGFDEAEIREHFRAACRIAGAARMAA